MHFVWITKDVPFNPDCGLMVYSSGLLRGALMTGATGILVAYARPEASGVAMSGLEVMAVQPQTKTRALSLLTSDHSDSFRHRSKQFSQAVDAAMKSGPDFVVVDYFSVGWVLPQLSESIRTNKRKPLVVFVSHNFESTLRAEVAESASSPLMRAVLRIDARKAVSLEKALVAASDLLVVISEDDALSYRKMAPEKPILTLTPGYDGKLVPPSPMSDEIPRRVIIGGAFDWIAKQMNLRRFLDKAEGPFQRAGINVLVVGRAPEQFIRSVSSQYPFCSFTGRVDDVRPFLRTGRIGLMPDDVGGGFKVKYLDYIFAGLPVATIRSQVRGLPVDPDRDMIARETMADLVESIVEKIDDLDLLNGMQNRCWAGCASAFKWQDRGDLLIREIANLLDGRAKGRETVSPSRGLDPTSATLTSGPLQ